MLKYIVFERKETMNTALIIIAIVAYLAFTVYIGFRFSKKNKSTDDFYLGGRKLGPLVTAMSAEASDMSSWLLMGLPGVALLTGLTYPGGFAEAVWTAIGLAVGTYLNWLIVAKRLRRYTEKTNSNTLPDFFSNRFGDKKGVLCAIAAVIIVLFFVPYTGSGFAAVGKLFDSFFGVPYHVALIIGAAVIAAYTILGGFLAASTTDFIQSIVMTVALVVVVVFGVANANTDGFISLSETFSELNFSLTGADGSYGVLPIISTLAWGLGYFGMPHILLRFMAIEDDRKLSLSRRVASIWVVISMGVAIFIGVIGYNYVVNNNLVATEGFDAEKIIVYMAKGLSEIGWLPAIVAGVILSGILASIMSTSDSQMLAAGSSISENIVGRFSPKKLSAKQQMWVARGTVLLISVIGVILAWNPGSSVFRIVSFAWAGFGATFGPLMLFALFWKRTTKWGALAGMISGAVTVLAWKFLVRPLGGVWDLYELLPAFIVSAIAIVVVSLLTPAPEQAVLDEFDEVTAGMKQK